MLHFAIHQLRNSKQYYICMVVGGIVWSASSEVNKVDGGESDDVYFHDHVLPIIFIGFKNDTRVHHTYLHFVGNV